jgi:hypothetical protein
LHAAPTPGRESPQAFTPHRFVTVCSTLITSN